LIPGSIPLIILRPSLLNSAIGLFNTIINIYTARDGYWLVMAIVTASVTASSAVILLGLLLYNFWYLQKARSDHDATVSKDSKLGESYMGGCPQIELDKDTEFTF
jgi:hypothetical protein